MDHDKYVNDKTFLAYQKYLRGEAFAKARAVIVVDGKVVFIKNGKELTIPGGGVDDGETPEQAAVREAEEEAGYICEVRELLQQNNYQVNMAFGDVDFVSERQANIYLCTPVKKEDKKIGLDGEYAGEVSIQLLDSKNLSKCHVDSETIEKVDAFIKNAKDSEK